MTGKWVPRTPGVDRSTPARPRRLATQTDGQYRVGIFTDDFFPQSGGVARSIELQIRELARLGIHVTLVAPRTKFSPPEVGDYLTMPVLRWPGSPSHMCSLQFAQPFAAYVAERFAFDIVHSQNERGSMALAASVARRLGVPHVHTFHSNYAGIHDSSPVAAALSSSLFLPVAHRIVALSGGRKGKLPVGRPDDSFNVEGNGFALNDWKNVARLARNVDAFTSPAPFVVDAIVDASGGALADRAHVVPSGVSHRFVEARRRRPLEGPIRFLSCGRLGAEKRVDAIVKAFALLGRDDAELVIVGQGDEAGELRRLAGRVEHGRVEFAGHISDVSRVAQEMADADVFVLASHRFDTQGMVLAEAAAAGTGILYCDDRLTVGVTPDNALLTEPDPAALSEGMRVLAADPERRRRMAAASRALAPGLTTERMGERYLSVCRGARRRS